MDAAERVKALADTMDDEPTLQALLMCVAGMLGSGDKASVSLLSATAARFSAAHMFHMGMNRADAEAMVDRSGANE